MIYLSTLIISMFTTIVLIPIFMGLAVKLKALDVPNERKVHQIPTPKSGGISMALGAMVPILLWMPKNDFTLALLIGAWIIVLFGMIDDFMDMDYRIKFCGQLVAALIVVLYGGLKIKSMGALLLPGFELPDLVSIPLTIFVIVGVTNAINLSDGLDGLAGAAGRGCRGSAGDGTDCQRCQREDCAPDRGAGGCGLSPRSLGPALSGQGPLGTTRRA